MYNNYNVHRTEEGAEKVDQYDLVLILKEWI